MPANSERSKVDGPSAAGNRRKISRGIDHLGWLNAQLRDLSGPATLAAELIQNADDAPDARYIAFDVTDESLIVDNDGYFVDCGQAEEEECLGRNGDGASAAKCDFHRFRNVAGGDKRNQGDTVGAFGIGFVVVYQVTDKPELISSGHHWIIDETEKLEDRIEACYDLDCTRSHGTVESPTRFILPWATDANSILRKKLSRSAMTPQGIEEMATSLAKAVPDAFLFLNKLTGATVKRNGRELLSLERRSEADTTFVDINDETREWRTFRGNFDDSAKRMKAQGLPIGVRRADVTVAIPADPESVPTGLFYAFLPTQQQTGLPLHINADFFPSSDRKRLILEDGFQADWNRHAIDCAARVVACNLEDIHAFVGADRFWQLMTEIREAGRDEASPVRGMWDLVRDQLQDSRIVLCQDGELRRPTSSLWPRYEHEFAATQLLSELGLDVAHTSLRPHANLLRSGDVGIPQLTLSDVARVLQAHTQPADSALSQLPEPLRSDECMDLLWKALVSLDDTTPKADDQRMARDILQCCPVAPTTRHTYSPFGRLYRCPQEAQATFESALAHSPFALTGTACDPLIERLCQDLDPKAAVSLLTEDIKNGHRVTPEAARSLLRWFAQQPEALMSDSTLEELAELPLFPVGGRLQPLHGLALPSGFSDPLGIAHVVDMSSLEGTERLLRRMGAEQLDLHHYVVNQLAHVVGRQKLKSAQIKLLYEFLIKHRAELDGDREARAALASMPLCPLPDGSMAAPAESYLATQVVEAVLPRAKLLKARQPKTRSFLLWLGVSDTPRTSDVRRQIRWLSKAPVSGGNIRNAQALLRFLIDDGLGAQTPQVLEEAARLSWLPADGDVSRWYQGDELYTVFRRHTFESQGKFLDLPRREQNLKDAGTLLKRLGVHTEPPPPLVVRHLLFLIERGAPVHNDIYRFLNDHATHPALQMLRDKPCIVTTSGTPVRPDQAYWSDHPYGRFRHRLGTGLRPFSHFLDQVGVRGEPTAEDSAAVLRDIERECAEFNAPIDEEAARVVAACWRMLSAALPNPDFDDDLVADLHTHRVVPNRDAVLKVPTTLFLDDRPGWAEVFDSLIADSIVNADQDAIPAWRCAGVRPLSEAVGRSVDADDDRHVDDVLRTILTERRNELGRSLATVMSGPEIRAAIERLDHAECFTQRAVEVIYEMQAFGEQKRVGPVRSDACWDPDSNAFYRRTGLRTSSHVLARELAYGLCTSTTLAAPVATAIRVVLQADTAAQAAEELDDLGFAHVDLGHLVFGPGEAIDGIGSDDADYGAAPETEEPEEDSSADDTLEDDDDSDPRAEDRPGEPRFSIESSDDDVEEDHSEPPAENQYANVTSSPDAPSGRPKADSQPRTGSTGGERSSGTRQRGSSHSTGRQGQYQVYVARDGEDESSLADRADEAAIRGQVEQAGVELAIQYERNHARYPEVMPPGNPGFDIQSKDGSDEIVRYIEVKSTSEDWREAGVGLTEREFEEARTRREDYWLYVVERAGHSDAQLYRINDPATLVNRYFFNGSWRRLSED